jgi:hypothetical protein
MRKSYQLKPQDVLILLKLISRSEKGRLVDIAMQLGLSQSEVSHGLSRLVKAQLLSSDKKEPLRHNALEFLVYGLKYVFPAEIGAIARGIVTAHSAPPLSQDIVSSKEDHYVWPDPQGEQRGQSITPLYSSAPFAAMRDSKLHELLALVDVLRVGRVREQTLARGELEKRIVIEP